jgi:hypothetical protein
MKTEYLRVFAEAYSEMRASHEEDCMSWAFLDVKELLNKGYDVTCLICDSQNYSEVLNGINYHVGDNYVLLVRGTLGSCAQQSTKIDYFLYEVHGVGLNIFWPIVTPEELDCQYLFIFKKLK